MKAYKPLVDRFRKMNQTTPEWHKSARFPKTMETANSILYRDAIVDASTLAYMAYCLEFTNVETVTLLENYAKEVPKKAAEVAVLKRLINAVDWTKDEQQLVEKLRELSTTKKKLVFDLMKSLEG